MTFKYCPSNGGFYSDEVHSIIPEDAVEITSELRDTLLLGQSQGKRIIMIDGAPVAQDQPAPSDETLLLSVRATRNQRLAECDWTQLPDAPVSEEQLTAWRTYRQALRDLPDGEGFDPGDFTWPVRPI